MHPTHSLLFISLALAVSADHGPGPYPANNKDQIGQALNTPAFPPLPATTTAGTWPTGNSIFLPGPVMTSDIGLPLSMVLTPSSFPTLSPASSEGVFPPTNAAGYGTDMMTGTGTGTGTGAGTGTAAPTESGPKPFPTGLEPAPVSSQTTLETYTRPMPTHFYYPPHEDGTGDAVDSNWQQDSWGTDNTGYDSYADQHDNQRDWGNQRWKGKWYQ